LLPGLAASPGIACALYATRSAAVTRASSAEDDRAGDRYAEALLAVEVTSAAGTAAAVTSLGAENLASLGGGAHLLAAPCVLKLSYALQAPAVNRP
jgi:hypothetical protein